MIAADTLKRGACTLAVRMVPQVTKIRVFPDPELTEKHMRERPHMREQLSAMLRDGIEVSVRVTFGG